MPADTIVTEHTPGPWIAHEPGKGLTATDAAALVTADAGKWRIALVSTSRQDGVGVPRVTGIANARLIAATPELLAALLELHDAATSFFTSKSSAGFLARFKPALKQASAAIAKATGQEVAQ